MPQKITDFTEVTIVNDDDLFTIIDIGDDTMSVDGTNKKITASNVANSIASKITEVPTIVSSALAAKSNIASPTFTGNVVLPSTTTIGSVSSTELGYLDGVTSAIQTQFAAKANIASPTFTGTITSGAITSSGAVSATSLSAGSGTITTTGAISGSSITSTGVVNAITLAIGTSNDKFTVSSAGAVVTASSITCASLSAGSGSISAATFTGALTGNASTATTATTVSNGAITPAKFSTGGPSWDSATGTLLLSQPGIEVGSGITGNANSYIDFHSSHPLIDNDARIIRATGVNGTLGITNQGTGAIVMTASSGVTFGSANMPTPSGTAPIYGARAWVNFNGTTTTPTIRSSGNVATVTKSAAGNYVVTLNTGFGHTDYAVIATIGNNSNLTTTTTTDNAFIYEDGAARTSNSFRLRIKQDDGGNSEDRTFVSVVVFA